MLYFLKKKLLVIFTVLILLNLIYLSISFKDNKNIEFDNNINLEEDEDEYYEQLKLSKQEEIRRLKLEEEVLNNNKDIYYNSNYNSNFSIDLSSSNILDWKFYIFSFYEVIMIAFLFSYIFVCLTGKVANNKLSYQWICENNKYFNNNYALVGTGQDSDGGSLLQESYNNFKYYASGRCNINYTLISLDLSKRHDLVTILSSVAIPYEKDRIIYEVSLNIPYLPHVFSICRKKDVKYMRKTYTDIDLMTESYNNINSVVSYKNKSLFILTEDDDILDKILVNDKSLNKTFREIENFIDIIYLTDRQTFSKEKIMLFCSFYIKNDMKDSLIITKFVHKLIDRLATIEFSSNNKRDAEKRRQNYVEAIEKQMLKQKESEEPRQKKEKPVKIPKTREEAIKLEEKERKNRIKKERSKITKVMK